MQLTAQQTGLYIATYSDQSRQQVEDEVLEGLRRNGEEGAGAFRARTQAFSARAKQSMIDL